MTAIERSVVPVYPRKRGSLEQDKQHYNLSIKHNKFHPRRRTVVILHGYMGRIGDYDGALESLSDRFNVLGIDLRAHGHSEYPTSKEVGWSMRDLAFDVYQAVDSMIPNGSTFAIMASSMSTGISLELATMYPERVEQLFLMAPTSQFTVPVWSKLIMGIGKLTQLKLMELLFEGIAVFLGKLIGEHEEWQDGIDRFQHLDLEIHKKILDEALRVWEVQADRVNVPVLILSGEDDKLVPTEESKQLANLLPHASIITFEDAEHRLIRCREDQVIDLFVQWMQESYEILRQKDYSDTDIESSEDSYYLRVGDTIISKAETVPV